MEAPVDEPRRWTLLDAEAGLQDGGFSLAREAPDLASRRA